MVNVLASRLDEPDRSQVLRDIANATIERASVDGARFVFHLADYTRPPYRGQRAFPVEGVTKDVDGVDVTVTMYCDQNRRLLELEILRWAEDDLMSPDWSALTVY